jgi:2'-5' RNA ligase
MTLKPAAPGLRLYEYRLVTDIPEAQRLEIERERLRLAASYGMHQPQTGRPHIALARFKAVKAMEEKILYQLKMIAMAEKPFTAALQDYDGYPMHAIFIQIANQQRVLDLIKNLKQARPLMKLAGDEPHFMLDPQIVLAGRLENDQYMEIMHAYEHRKFTAGFIVDAFLLLRRAEDEQCYQLVKRFELGCLPVYEKQGVLF